MKPTRSEKGDQRVLLLPAAVYVSSVKDATQQFFMRQTFSPPGCDQKVLLCLCPSKQNTLFLWLSQLSLNQHLHKAPQTLMVIIMLISSGAVLT